MDILLGVSCTDIFHFNPQNRLHSVMTECSLFGGVNISHTKKVSRILGYQVIGQCVGYI